MMQTGPVVTLQVAKFGASYHGLGALLSEATTEKTTSRAQPHENTSVLYCVVDLGSSERLHGGSKKKKDQMMQRNRQLYRSNPNMTDLHLEDGEEPADPDARGNVTSISTINLCTDTFPREYLTLPNPKSKDKSLSEINRPHQTFKMSLGALEEQSSNKRAFMRQALSQENLCMDSGGPLLDKRQNAWQQRDQGAKQTQSHYSSFPIRSSLSSNDILSNHSSPTKQQQSSRTSAAGVWRMPFSQQATPAPSIQPIRIDIPVTRAASTQSNLPLTTFQQNSSLLAVKMSQTLKVSAHTQSPQSQMDHIYACPVPAAKKLPQPQQQRSATCRGKTEKPQVSITPTKKHVSFQEDAPQQNKGEGGPVRQRDPRVLCDPWKREAQEKLEKQQRLQAVEHLVEEVQGLQAKAKRTAEENNRLRRLNLEWQFQKRVQEMQQRGEDEQDEEDLDMMVTLQQLENRMPHAEKNRSSGGNANRKLKEEENQVGNNLFHEEDKAKTDQRASGVHNMASEANQEEKMKKCASAPEKLTFRERQRLFSLASSA